MTRGWPSTREVALRVGVDAGVVDHGVDIAECVDGLGHRPGGVEVGQVGDHDPGAVVHEGVQ